MATDPLRACLARVFELPESSIPDFEFTGPHPHADGPPLWELRLADWVRTRGLELSVAAIPTVHHHWPRSALVFDHIRIANSNDGPQAAVFRGDSLTYTPAGPYPMDTYPQSYLIFGDE